MWTDELVMVTRDGCVLVLANGFDQMARVMCVGGV